MNKKTVRPIFTVEFKQSAVKLITEQGYTRQEAAKKKVWFSTLSWGEQ